MTTINQAIRLAQKRVGMPQGHGTSWHFYAPYYHDKPHGPTTQVNAWSYSQALQKRKYSQVSIALTALGLPRDVIEWAQYESTERDDWRAIVRLAVRGEA